MKIMMGSYQTLSISHGGPRVQILETKNELEKLGVTVSLFDVWKEFSYKEYDAFHLFAGNIGTFHIAKHIHSLGIPLVTSSIFFTRHSPFAIKSVVTANKILHKFKKGLWSDYWLSHQIFKWSKSVLPNTTDEATLIEKGLSIPKEKITVIPNGVHSRFENGNPTLFKKKYGIEKFILNVGHIGPERKNVLNLLRAVKTIDYPVVIIGRITSGKYYEQCKEEAAKNKNILLIDGLLNDSEMLASAYAACDVFVLPSLFETPGIAALEAGLAGAKIVITPHGGTKEYFLSMAEYVEPTSAESIRKGIINALDKKKDVQLQTHIKKEFLWSSVAEKTLNVYKTL